MVSMNLIPLTGYFSLWPKSENNTESRLECSVYDSDNKKQTISSEYPKFAHSKIISMRYNELVAISGLGGLYQLMSTKSDGAIVKNLDDNTTKFVAARSHNVTPLDSIEVYTETDNVRLYDVFMSFLQNEASLEGFDLAKADNKALKAKFGELFPAYDKEKVYVSDMKKMIKWFGILKRLDLLKEEEVSTEESTN